MVGDLDAANTREGGDIPRDASASGRLQGASFLALCYGNIAEMSVSSSSVSFSCEYVQNVFGCPRCVGLVLSLPASHMNSSFF